MYTKHLYNIGEVFTESTGLSTGDRLLQATQSIGSHREPRGQFFNLGTDNHSHTQSPHFPGSEDHRKELSFARLGLATVSL